jgi:hypothetical protein
MVNSLPQPDKNKNVPKHSEGKPDLCTLLLVGSWTDMGGGGPAIQLIYILIQQVPKGEMVKSVP